LNDLENNPICAVSVDASVPCVSVTWRRYATSTQLRFVHENVIHLLQKHGLTKILGNDTGLPTIHPDDQTWIVRDWMPRAVAAGLRAVASKKPEQHFGRVSVDGIMSAVAPHLPIRSFNDLEQARSWLNGLPLHSAGAHPHAPRSDNGASAG